MSTLAEFAIQMQLQQKRFSNPNPWITDFQKYFAWRSQLEMSSKIISQADFINKSLKQQHRLVGLYDTIKAIQESQTIKSMRALSESMMKIVSHKTILGQNILNLQKYERKGTSNKEFSKLKNEFEITISELADKSMVDKDADMMCQTEFVTEMISESVSFIQPTDYATKDDLDILSSHIVEYIRKEIVDKKRNISPELWLKMIDLVLRLTAICIALYQIHEAVKTK